MADKLLRLIRKVNSCLASETSAPAEIDNERLYKLLTEDELAEFLDSLNCSPPRVQAYQNRFYHLEHCVNEGFNHRIKRFTIVRNDDGEIHTIMSEHGVEWTREAD